MKRGISFAIAACVAVVACLHGGAIYAGSGTVSVSGGSFWRIER